jgi:type I site-specific restriction-modification system R (restriction) subunit
MTIQCRVWDRKTWQQERDGKNVPKGAAKVSVGDALDKFHKARVKGPEAAVAAAADLKKVVDLYVATIAKAKPKQAGAKAEKYGDLQKRIASNLAANLKDYTDANRELIEIRRRYKTDYEAAALEVRQLGAEFIQWQRTQQGEFTPTNAKKAKDAIAQLRKDVGGAKELSSKVTDKHLKDITALQRQTAGDNWYPGLVNGLIDCVKELPASL